MAKRKGKDRPGPKENRLKLHGDWKKAVEKAVKKKRPKGWPGKKNSNNRKEGLRS